MIDLHKGDCLTVMDELIEQGIIVDAIIADIPLLYIPYNYDIIL